MDKPTTEDLDILQFGKVLHRRPRRAHEESPSKLEWFRGRLMEVKNPSRIGWWRFYEHYDQDGYCDNPARGY